MWGVFPKIISPSTYHKIRCFDNPFAIEFVDREAIGGETSGLIIRRCLFGFLFS
jgi:hypothetical protein